MLAYTPLGYSLPDLTLSGYASPSAAWGGPLTVTLNVQNLGASTLIEPTQLLPGASSRADSSPTTVAVYLARRPDAPVGGRGSVLVGNIGLPSIEQNDLFTTTATTTLPNRPRNFPDDGGRVYVSFRINPTGASPEADITNNTARGNRVRIAAPLPRLVTAGLDLPADLQPGDTIQPTLRIQNIGPADTAPQGPFTVALVASTTRRFDRFSSTVATYNVGNISGIATTSTASHGLGNQNLDPQNNVLTITGAPVTLPTTPAVYYLGVVIDPTRRLRQIARPGHPRSGVRLDLSRQVGPIIRGLPPAGVLYNGGVANNRPFPIPANLPLIAAPTTPPGGTTSPPEVILR